MDYILEILVYICFVGISIVALWAAFNFERSVELYYKFLDYFNYSKRPYLFTDSYLRFTLKVSIGVACFMGGCVFVKLLSIFLDWLIII